MRDSSFRLALLLAVLACADRPGVPPPTHASSARLEVRAPIVRVAVRIAESFPPQYFADVTSALPDGCAQFARIEVRRAGNTVIVDVFNTRPAGEDVACAMLYGEHESTTALGSEFTPGIPYTLDVNGTAETFVAQ